MSDNKPIGPFKLTPTLLQSDLLARQPLSVTGNAIIKDIIPSLIPMLSAASEVGNNADATNESALNGTETKASSSSSDNSDSESSDSDEGDGAAAGSLLGRRKRNQPRKYTDDFGAVTPKSSPKRQAPKRQSTSKGRTTKDPIRPTSAQKKALKNATPPSTDRRKSRGKRCGKCVGCMRDDCGKCIYCLDKPKYGGPGKKKQRCALRECTDFEHSIKRMTTLAKKSKLTPIIPKTAATPTTSSNITKFAAKLTTKPVDVPPRPAPMTTAITSISSSSLSQAPARVTIGEFDLQAYIKKAQAAASTPIVTVPIITSVDSTKPNSSPVISKPAPQRGGTIAKNSPAIKTTAATSSATKIIPATSSAIKTAAKANLKTPTSSTISTASTKKPATPVKNVPTSAIPAKSSIVLTKAVTIPAKSVPISSTTVKMVQTSVTTVKSAPLTSTPVKSSSTSAAPVKSISISAIPPSTSKAITPIIQSMLSKKIEATTSVPVKTTTAAGSEKSSLPDGKKKTGDMICIQCKRERKLNVARTDRFCTQRCIIQWMQENPGKKMDDAILSAASPIVPVPAPSSTPSSTVTAVSPSGSSGSDSSRSVPRALRNLRIDMAKPGSKLTPPTSDEESGSSDEEDGTHTAKGAQAKGKPATVYATAVPSAGVSSLAKTTIKASAPAQKSGVKVPLKVAPTAKTVPSKSPLKRADPTVQPSSVKKLKQQPTPKQAKASPASGKSVSFNLDSNEIKKLAASMPVLQASTGASGTTFSVVPLDKVASYFPAALKQASPELEERKISVPSGIPTDVRKWTVSDVVKYFKRTTDCQDYVIELFESQEVDGVALLLLTHETLVKCLGIKLGRAVKIMARVEEIKRYYESQSTSAKSK